MNVDRSKTAVQRRSRDCSGGGFLEPFPKSRVVLNSKSFTAFSGEDTRMTISAFDPEGEELSYALSEKDSYLFRESYIS